jgi:hypothetical protein
VCTDLAGLTPGQLRNYASGYTDALEETRSELLELRELVRTLTIQLERAETTADQIYHDAYCGCGERIAGVAIRWIRVLTARAESRA